MKKLGLLAAVVVLVNVAIYGTAAWVLSSVVTSTVKAAADKCGTTYKVEDFGVAGNWFCGK